jgi:hypothetical protein
MGNENRHKNHDGEKHVLPPFLLHQVREKRPDDRLHWRRRCGAGKGANKIELFWPGCFGAIKVAVAYSAALGGAKAIAFNLFGKTGEEHATPNQRRTKMDESTSQYPPFPPMR